LEDKIFFTQYPRLLQTSGLSYGMIQAWDQLQRLYYNNDFTVIEVKSKDQRQNYWQCYLRQPHKSKSSFLGLSSKKQNIYDVLNKDLKTAFANPVFNGNQSFWNKLAKNLFWKGFFVPIEELKRFNKKQLDGHFAFLNALKNHFPYFDFLKNSYRTFKQNQQEAPHLAIVAMWEFYIYYCGFLKTIAKEDPYVFQLLLESRFVPL